MNKQPLQSAMDIARKVGYALLATTGEQGTPHIATAGRLGYDPGARTVTLTEWYCFQTMKNLQINTRVSIVAWDPERERQRIPVAGQ